MKRLSKSIKSSQKQPCIYTSLRFRSQYRLSSLYADFRQQLEVNPEGYHANIVAWTNALADAARAGVIPTRGITPSSLSIRATDDLARALQHPQYGKPTCLPAVFHDAMQKKEMILEKDFLSAKESIYKTSWIPSPWKVLQWSLRQVGVLGQPSSPQKLEGGIFVVLKNVEAAANEVLKKMKEHTSTTDRVMSKADFSKRFAGALNPAAALSMGDINILLVHLQRDKQALLCDGQTVKFKAEHEAVPEPITHEDQAIANLRDTLANINAQIPPLMEKIAAADAAAREAVTAKQMIRAKAALRSKKLAESALAQRSDVALQLESVYTQLQSAADQVEIVEAMRAGADVLKSLNEKVGGAEGVQGVVDAVNEQMATAEEITNIINETDQPLDEGEIDDEFEALEKAEKEKMDREEAAKTAARLAELAEVEETRKQKEREEQAEQAQQQREEEAKVQKEKRTEHEVEKASEELSKLSFVQKDKDEDMKDAEKEERIAIPS
jgi:charged multivesicular body protein 7